MKVRIAAGGEYDLASTAELRAHQAEVMARFDVLIRDQLRGIKIMDAPVLIAAATGTSLTLPMTGNVNVVQAPEQGFFWRVCRITVISSGVDTGAVSLYVSSDGTINLNRLVDNTLKIGQAYYPPRLYLQPGQQLAYGITSVSGNTYRVAANIISVPAEMMGKLI